MDSIFGALIWLVIISVWIFSALKKTKRGDSESRERVPSGLEEKILIEVPRPPAAEVIVEETERGFPNASTSLSTDLSTAQKLQEGIIFFVILGPPKAYQFLGLYSKKSSG